MGGSGRQPWEMDGDQNGVWGREEACGRSGGGVMGRVCVVGRPAIGRDDKGNDLST